MTIKEPLIDLAGEAEGYVGMTVQDAVEGEGARINTQLWGHALQRLRESDVLGVEEMLTLGAFVRDHGGPAPTKLAGIFLEGQPVSRAGLAWELMDRESKTTFQLVIYHTAEAGFQGYGVMCVAFEGDLKNKRETVIQRPYALSADPGEANHTLQGWVAWCLSGEAGKALAVIQAMGSPLNANVRSRTEGNKKLH